MSGSRVYDPSKLHLKKELTQIRKAARVLRDPGTSSSWRSPLSSTRSAAAVLSALNTPTNRKNPPFSSAHYHFDLQNATKSTASNKESGKEDKKVFLYNWRSRNNKSSSDKSLVRVNLDGDASSSFPGSVPSASASVDDCVSDARNGGGRAADSKSETYVDEIIHLHGHGDGRRHGRNHAHSNHHTTGFRCKDTRLATMASPASVRRAMGKMKFRKTSLLQKHRKKRLHELVPQRRSMNSKLALKGGTPCDSIGLSQDDSVSLIDQSDDTEEYYNSEDLGHSSATSPLLSRIMQMNFPQSSNKFVRGGRRGDSSYTYSTPALSTSSFNRYFNNRNPSNVGSWDGTTVSLNDVDGEADDPLNLPGRHGCGIPCWSRRSTPKHKGGYGSCSPSLSDTLRRKGSRLICGSQKAHHKRHHSLSSCIGKKRIVSGVVQGHIPLLNNGKETSSFGTVNSDDELSTNFGELDLEGLSRLDGRRWSSSCRSQEGLELVALANDSQDESMLENVKSFSQRHRPMFFDALVGQNIVVQSLMNSLTRGRIAPVYLFQGPRGTGKTSAAKIFAAAVNCLATEETKPCGVCQECAQSRNIMEVNGTNKKGIDNVRYLLKRLAVAPPSAISSYKVFVIDECHLLPSKIWAALLKFLQEPLPQVVFIFITTDLENVPRTILSRCQKHLFNKIKDVDIVTRLQRIAVEENLEVEPDALELIALNADGSLRDAETMLEQLSLLGKRITTTLVNELVGVVSDEKLIELLELAISSNTAETVKRARELLDTGADPLVLMSQLASLIMDIIAGNYLMDDAQCSNSLVGRSLSEVELEKLKNALKLLSEAEKQLRVSSERSTWFTATLLQLGSVTSPEFTLSGSSRKQSSKTTDEDQTTASRDGPGSVQKSDPQYMSRRLASTGSLPADGKGHSGHQEALLLLRDGISSNSKASHRSRHSVDTVSSYDDMAVGQVVSSQFDTEKLDHLWLQCTGRCHYEKLRQLLQNYGKLISISEVDGVLLAYIAFGDEKIKARAERYIISITNSFETVLRRSVEIRFIAMPDGLIPTDSREAIVSPHSSGSKLMEPMNKEENVASLNNSPLLDERSLTLKAEGNDKDGTPRERRRVLPMQRIESIIREQRLETAWLQAVEKGTPSSTSRLRPERNQVLPQDGAVHSQNQSETVSSMDLSLHRWDDELSHEMKALKINDKKAVDKDQAAPRAMIPPISPSLLHQSNCGGNLNKEYQGCESGPGGKGCNILFCWNTRDPKRAKVKRGTQVGECKGGGFLCFGECRKSRH